MESKSNKLTSPHIVCRAVLDGALERLGTLIEKASAISGEKPSPQPDDRAFGAWLSGPLREETLQFVQSYFEAIADLTLTCTVCA